MKPKDLALKYYESLLSSQYAYSEMDKIARSLCALTNVRGEKLSDSTKEQVVAELQRLMLEKNARGANAANNRTVCNDLIAYLKRCLQQR